MKELVQHISSQLEAVYSADEAREMAWWLLEEETGLSRSQMLSGCKGTTNFSNLQEKIDRLLRFEPIQYIFGHTLWCGLDLKVTSATLIPRPETAELVERVVKSIELKVNSLEKSSGKKYKVLDIGTGSGCIAIALKKRHPEWAVTGIDISEEAIEVAKENAVRNEAEIAFCRMDIFSDEIERFCPFDIVVSNPPYVRESEKAGIRANVLDYEPATALFVPDDDPLRFYRRIAELHLGKRLFFEINEALGAEMAQLLRESGYTGIQLTKDIYGKARIIEGRMA